MRFTFDKAACQNTRRALRKEWLLTNGRGDYASSTILGCNTRKYHGLLVANTPQGRHVLLSTLEESIVGGGKEFFLSTRQHPGVLYPHGHESLESVHLDPWPQSIYKIGEVQIVREMLLVQGKCRLMVRYTISGPKGLPPLTLKIRPLLAFRNFHALTQANPTLREETSALPNGFAVHPYVGLPSLYLQAKAGAQGAVFTPGPDWCRSVEYFREQSRGFPFSEDLFIPGLMEIPLPALPEGGSVYLTAGTEPLGGEDLAALWQKESEERVKAYAAPGIIGHLTAVGEQFCIETPSRRPAVLAGYHWFDAWGRDTLISLPGLTFLAGREAFGRRVLQDVGRHVHNGLVPNMFSEKGEHSYNSVDAALWYAFGVQKLLETSSDFEEAKTWTRQYAWPAIKAIVEGYRRGPGMGIFVDDEGLLHAGDAHTQLTWMDAQANGAPVTPRHGCPVEVNALWYNTLAMADRLANLYGEPELAGHGMLHRMRRAFVQRFWVEENGGYVGDVWRDGCLGRSIRPNQIFAVSLKHSILPEDYHAQVVDCVRDHLLTPYGLRTLAPSSPAYKGHYAGDPASRDAAYHQGTVWPWPLGHYTDALLRVVWDAEDAARTLLDTVTPLFCNHLARSGVGCLSEVMDGSPPYTPEGCISQAWSVAESLRMLLRLRDAAPAVYHDWEERVSYCMAHPSDETVGICRITMTPGAAPGKRA